MKIPHPFVIQILNKQEVHPLQAASNHSGEKLMDFTSAGEFTPAKRSAIVVATDLILPMIDTPLYNNLPEYLQFKKAPRPEAIRNARNTMWIKVSWREKRVNAQFCRQFELPMPPEIELSEAKKALAEFAQIQLVSQGMIADLAIHEARVIDPETKIATTCDRTGYLMCTTRPFLAGEFTNKTRAWNERSQLLQWRKAWFETLTKYMPKLPEKELSQNSRDLLKFCTRFAKPNTDLPVQHASEIEATVDEPSEPTSRPRQRL